MILFDANVLVYATNADAPQHGPSHTVVRAALDGRVAGVLVPQVLLEFFAVVTHRLRVRRPLDASRAWEQVAALRASLPVLEVRPEALTILGELVLAGQPEGGAIFDLFLIAQMRTHGVGTICTYSAADFAGRPGILALRPEDVLSR